MRIDNQTLAIVLGIMNLLQIIALFTQYIANKLYKGPGWWMLGSIAWSLAFAFNILRNDPALGRIGIFGNNALFISGLGLFYVGLARFLGQRERRGLLIPLSITAILIAYYFTYISENITVRWINFSIVIAIISFLIAWTLQAHKTDSINASVNFLSLVFIASGVFYLLRTLAPFTSLQIEGLLTDSYLQTITYLTMLIIGAPMTFGFIMLVSQRLNAENIEAKESQELIFNISPDAVMITRLADGLITNVNDGFFAMTGFKRADVTGKSGLEINLWHDPADWQMVVGLLNGKGVCENFEALFQRKDGSLFNGSLSAKLFSLQNVQHIISVTRDISERKQVEKKLSESEQRFKGLIEKAADLILVIDANGIVQFASPAVETVTGFTPQEITGQSFLNWLHPDDVPQAKTSLASRSRNPGTAAASMTVRTRHKTGEWRVIDALGTNLLAEPAINGIVLNIRDITEASKAEAQLKQSMLELSGLNEVVKKVNRSLSVSEVIGTAVDEIIKIVQPDAALYFSRNGNELVLSSAKPDEARTHFDAVALHRLGECLCKLALQQDRNLFSNDISRDDRCGGEVPGQSGSCSFAAIPIRRDTEIIGVLGLASETDRDFEQQSTFLDALIGQVSIALENATLYETAQREIEERKRIALELSESEEKFRSVIEQTADGIILTDEDGTIIVWNSGQEQITALAREAAIGKKIWDVLFQLSPLENRTGQSYDQMRSAYQMAISSGQSPFYNRLFENEIVHANGQRRVVQTLAFVISNASGHLVGSISRDITQEKKNENKLRRQLSELDVLFENSLAINRLLEPTQIGQKLIEILNKKLDWHHAAVRLYHPETGRMELLALKDPTSSDEELKVQITRLNQLISRPGQGLSGWALEHKQAIRCPIVKDHPSYIETYTGIQSGLYMPIRSGEEIIGVIAVESEEEDAFNEQDERLLATMSNQAAIAFQNARLYTLSQQELAERKRAEQQLIEAHAELEQRVRERTFEVQDLYDNAPCGYHSVDSSGKIVHINKTQLGWLGYSKEEVIGRQVTDFMTPETLAKFQHHFEIFKKSGIIKDLEMEFIRKDGSVLTQLVNATAIFDENGKFKHSRSTLLDIRLRKQSEQALRESEARLRQNRDELSAANHALEKAARLKDEFLASMSHELRTPLTGILGLSEALQLRTYGDLSEKQLRTVKNIENSGRHLLELINDILDLSKIEAGRFDMLIEPCLLNEICQASLQLTKGMAQQKHQKVAFSIQPADIVVRVDKRRMKQMLVNLLSNAVKFTNDGGELGLEVRGSPGSSETVPDLARGADQHDQVEGKVAITIWDKGIGIKQEDLPRLFHPFMQLDSSLSRQYAGTGLGLSLVQRMAELHNGSLQVESIFGQGSRFTLTLPWDVNIIQPTLKQVTSLDGLRTLTIDHQVVDSDSITRYLRNLGIENKVRTHAELISEYAALTHPDLILVEMNLKERSGLDALVELKSDPRTRTIPVIMMSVEESRPKALELGAAGYLVKPFSQDDLRSEIERAFGGIASTSLAQTPDSNKDGQTLLVADDNEENLQMLADFLKSRKFNVEKARDGIELLTMAERTHPDLMLVDIQMPEMDGLEAIRRIRAHPDTSLAATPIIAITALAMPADRERCLAAGANDYLSKPLELGKLVENIQRLI